MKRSLTQQTCFRCEKQFIQGLSFNGMWACSVDCFATLDFKSMKLTDVDAVNAIQILLRKTNDLYLQFPDKIFLTGKSSAPTIREFPSLKTEAEIKKLLTVCEEAPVVKGNHVAIDRTKRSAWQAKPGSVNVEWPAIDEILSEIQSTIVPPGSKISAEFHKLLVYQPGDFFHYHHASSKSDDHVLTLAVDCGDEFYTGGTVHFRYFNPNLYDKATKEEQGEEDEVEEQVVVGEKDEIHWQEVSWESSGKGDWAAWYCSTPHRVLEVKSGYRIVAIFNVNVETSDWEFRQGVPTRHYKLRHHPQHLQQQKWTPHRNIKLEEMPGGILPMIFSYCSVNDLISICGVSKIFSESISPTDILSQSISERIPQITSLMKNSQFSNIGFVLQQVYSFEGQANILVEKLHGKDYALAEAFRRNFGQEVFAKKVDVAVAKSEGINTEPTETKFVIAAGKVHQHEDFAKNFFGKLEDDLIYDVPQEFIKFNSEKKKATGRELREAFSSSKLENQCGVFFVPFVDVVWANNIDYLRHYCSEKDEKLVAKDEKEAAEIVTYHDVALFANVLGNEGECECGREGGMNGKKLKKWALPIC